MFDTTRQSVTTRRIGFVRKTNATESEEGIIDLVVAAPIVLSGREGDGAESVFRRSIGATAGIHEAVLTDLYRYLVLSNYVGLDGIRGTKATADLNLKYPSRRSLPRFEQKSGRFNASGAILSVLLDASVAADREFLEALSVAGSILVALVEGRILPKPVLDSRTPIRKGPRPQISSGDAQEVVSKATSAGIDHETETDGSYDWSAHIAVICGAVMEGDIELARRELVSRCPLTPLPKSPREAGLKLGPRPSGETTKRQYSKHQSTRVFVRDGFCDRYSGDRLVYPGVLRVLSDIFPREFQWHPNWKIGASHNLYWVIQPTIDHIIPVTYQGVDEDANWVTTSMLRNLWKSNASLETLGWRLYGCEEVPRWNGLLDWFLNYCDTHTDLRMKPHINQWIGPGRQAQQA